jgi:hypothetical protein
LKTEGLDSKAQRFTKEIRPAVMCGNHNQGKIMGSKINGRQLREQEIESILGTETWSDDPWP